MCFLVFLSSDEPLSRLGLHLFSTTSQAPCVAQQDTVTSARGFTADLLDSTLLRHNKITSFEEVWPKVVGKLVHAALAEYSNMDQHMKTMLEHL